MHSNNRAVSTMGAKHLSFFFSLGFVVMKKQCVSQGSRCRHPGTKPTERIGECGTSDTFPSFLSVSPHGQEWGNNPGITLPRFSGHECGVLTSLPHCISKSVHTEPLKNETIWRILGQRTGLLPGCCMWLMAQALRSWWKQVFASLLWKLRLRGLKLTSWHPGSCFFGTGGFGVWLGSLLSWEQSICSTNTRTWALSPAPTQKLVVALCTPAISVLGKWARDP